MNPLSDKSNTLALLSIATITASHLVIQPGTDAVVTLETGQHVQLGAVDRLALDFPARFSIELTPPVRSDLDAGFDDAKVQNPSLAYRRFTFTVGETADFDRDGDVGTDADLEAFFACLAGNCCSTCASADIDGDGDAGTDDDIDAFFMALAGGTAARPMTYTRNLGIVRDFIVEMATRRNDITFLTDSNGLFGGSGWNHGYQQALIDKGYQMYATDLISMGDNGSADGSSVGQGSGLGYGATADTNRISSRANSSLNTAITTAGTLRSGTKPNAALLSFWDVSAAGNSGPNDYVFAPAGTSWGAAQATGVMLFGTTTNPLGLADALVADAWLAKFPALTVGNVNYRWIDNGAGVGATGDHVSAGTGYSMTRVSQTLSAGTRAGTLEWRIPMGGAGTWFGTFMRVSNTTRTFGFGSSALYSLGSQSTYDLANAMLNTDGIGHFFDCLTARQDGAKKVLVILTCGPNDLSETNKIAGAPSGDASTAAVVKYNVEQTITRVTAEWVAAGFVEANLKFLLQVHPPIDSPDNALFTAYRAAMSQIAIANPTRVASVDLSALVTYAELADNTADPTFASNGTDEFHMKNANTYAILSGYVVQAALDTPVEGAPIRGRNRDRYRGD